MADELCTILHHRTISSSPAPEKSLEPSAKITVFLPMLPWYPLHFDSMGNKQDKTSVQECFSDPGYFFSSGKCSSTNTTTPNQSHNPTHNPTRYEQRPSKDPPVNSNILIKHNKCAVKDPGTLRILSYGDWRQTRQSRWRSRSPGKMINIKAYVQRKGNDAKETV